MLFCPTLSLSSLSCDLCSLSLLLILFQPCDFSSVIRMRFTVISSLFSLSSLSSYQCSLSFSYSSFFQPCDFSSSLSWILSLSSLIFAAHHRHHVTHPPSTFSLVIFCHLLILSLMLLQASLLFSALPIYSFP